MSIGKQICYLTFDNPKSLQIHFLNCSPFKGPFIFVFQDVACNADLNWKLISSSSAAWLKSSYCKADDIRDCEGKWNIAENSFFKDDSVVVQCGTLYQYTLYLVKFTLNVTEYLNILQFSKFQA